VPNLKEYQKFDLKKKHIYKIKIKHIELSNNVHPVKNEKNKNLLIKKSPGM